MSAGNIFFSGKWKSQTFTSSGTFTVPSGVSMVVVEMYGGGGGGGNYQDASPTYRIAYGGEAGQYVVKPVLVTAGASVAVTIGAGGNGASSINTKGSDGANTSFGSVNARGGFGGDIIEGFGTLLTTRGGSGRPSTHAIGGLNDFSGQINASGGNAGYGTGGSGNATDANGGIGAGGGGSNGPASGSGSAGDGGDGICIVYWQKD